MAKDWRTPGHRAYDEAREVHGVARVRLPRWFDLPESDRKAWERGWPLAADDSAQRFEAQAHAFAVQSGEDRELIKVLLRRLLRELEGGA